MEAKTEQNIDRIKLLENHLNELKTIVSSFVSKKGKQLRDSNLFKKYRKDTQKDTTLDDLDISVEPVIIEFVSHLEFQTRVAGLEAKLDIILEIVNSSLNRNAPVESLSELRQMIEDIKVEIGQVKNNSVQQQEQIQQLDTKLSHLETGGVLCFE